jgi:hypothetical protein
MTLSKMSVAVLFAIPVLAMSSAHAQQNPKLFSDLPQAMGRASVAAPAEKHVLREKAVGVNLLIINRRAAESVKKIDIDLFNGKTVTLTFTRIEERSAKSYTWYGEVKGSPMSKAMFTVVDGYLAGSVTLLTPTAVESYEITADASGVHTMRQIDSSKLPDGNDVSKPTSKITLPKLGTGMTAMMSSPTASGANVTNVGGTAYFKKVDIAVLYSQQLATAAGAAVGSLIQSAVDSSNATFNGNRVNTRLRLVNYAPAAYNEDGTTASAFTYMQSQTALRTTYGADVVAMLVENNLYVPGTNPAVALCGEANQVGAQASTSYIVVKRSCALGSWSFTHELGHLYGARHEATSDTTSTYAHGYVNLAQKWFTVMATQSACGSTPGCGRLDLFSTPTLAYLGNVIGVAGQADNARVVAENADRLASFYVSKARQETGIMTGTRAGATINLLSTSPYTFSVAPAGGAALTFDSTDNARLQFSDGMIGLDIEGNAGKVYRLYQAAFNRVPDLGGLGFWIYTVDNGATMVAVAEGFMNSDEFRSLYGSNPSNAEFLTKVYWNVLHRAPDQGGYDWWLNNLNTGAVSRAALLASFAESPENKSSTAAAVSHGIAYTRYGS